MVGSLPYKFLVCVSWTAAGSDTVCVCLSFLRIGPAALLHTAHIRQHDTDSRQIMYFTIMFFWLLVWLVSVFTVLASASLCRIHLLYVYVLHHCTVHHTALYTTLAGVVSWSSNSTNVKHAAFLNRSPRPASATGPWAMFTLRWTDGHSMSSAWRPFGKAIPTAIGIMPNDKQAQTEIPGAEGGRALTNQTVAAWQNEWCKQTHALTQHTACGHHLTCWQ